MCKERCRLVSEYVAAAAPLSRVARKLHCLHWDELTEALLETEAARAVCDRAREALHRHTAEHQECVRSLGLQANAHTA